MERIGQSMGGRGNVRVDGANTIAMTLLGGLAIVAGSEGCVRPKVLEKSHSRYNESIRHVYEEQLLENIVRCRYNESPFKLSVSSIAAQYELSGGRRLARFSLPRTPRGAACSRRSRRYCPTSPPARPIGRPLHSSRRAVTASGDS